MITLIETQVKVSMSLYEARTLCKILGSCSLNGLRNNGLTLGELETFDALYKAFGEYLNGDASPSPRAPDDREGDPQ